MAREFVVEPVGRPVHVGHHVVEPLVDLLADLSARLACGPLSYDLASQRFALHDEALALSPRRPKPSEVLLFLATLYATLKTQRNAVVFALVSAPRTVATRYRYAVFGSRPVSSNVLVVGVPTTPYVAAAAGAR